MVYGLSPLGASEALETPRLQPDRAAAALQEYIHAQGNLALHLVLVSQLLIIIGFVALAIWVRRNVANIRKKDLDAEHATTCTQELLRQGCVVIAGLVSEVSRLQDLNDNLKVKLQDSDHRMTRSEGLLRRQKPAKASPQSPRASSAARRPAPAPRRGMPREDGRALRQALQDALAAGSVVLVSSNSSNAHHPVAHTAHGQDGEHARKKSKSRRIASTESFENMVAIFGTPPQTSPRAAPSRTSYVDQACAPQSRTISLGRTDANGALQARQAMGAASFPSRPAEARSVSRSSVAQPSRAASRNANDVLAARYKRVWRGGVR